MVALRNVPHGAKAVHDHPCHAAGRQDAANLRKTLPEVGILEGAASNDELKGAVPERQLFGAGAGQGRGTSEVPAQPQSLEVDVHAEPAPPPVGGNQRLPRTAADIEHHLILCDVRGRDMPRVVRIERDFQFSQMVGSLPFQCCRGRHGSAFPRVRRLSRSTKSDLPARVYWYLHIMCGFAFGRRGSSGMRSQETSECVEAGK